VDNVASGIISELIFTLSHWRQQWELAYLQLNLRKAERTLALVDDTLLENNGLCPETETWHETILCLSSMQHMIFNTTLKSSDTQ